MNYLLNPACDVVFEKRKIEFLFLDHIIQMEGDDLSEVIVKILNLLTTKAGCGVGAIHEELPEYDPEDISMIIHELKQQEIIVPLLRSEEQNYFGLLDTQKKEHLLLWSSLPQLTSENMAVPVLGIGFRLGQQFILGFWQKLQNSQESTQKVFEWAAGREWLKRGHCIFNPSEGEGVISAQEFLSSGCLSWLRVQLAYLIERQVEEGLYVVDLQKATTHFSPLIERKSKICVTGPFEPVVEAYQQNAYGNDPFSRSCTAAVARYSTPVATWREDAWAWGSNPDPSLAMDVAYAEAIERYCAGTYPASLIEKGALKDNSEIRVDPYSLLKLTAAQLSHAGLKVFTDESPALWVPATELFSGKSVQILADLCLYPLNRPEGYGPYFWGNSSGMAAHRTKDRAILGALLELIERDAFMVTWLTKASPPHVNRTILPMEVIRQFKNELEVKGFKLELLDLTLRGIPTVMAILHREEWPAFCCGCATRLTYREAALAAFREAESALFGALQDEAEVKLILAHDVVLPEDHGCLYYNPQHLAHIRFLWESRLQSSMKEGVWEGLSPLEIAASVGISTLYCIEYPSPSPLLSVVRLDTTDLVSVTFGYGLEPWLSSVAQKQSEMFPHPLA